MKEKKSNLFVSNPNKGSFRCPCWRLGSDYAGFHLVSTLPDSGIDVYVAGRQHDHEPETDLKLDYAMVIDNNQSCDHLAVKVISELDKCKTSCPRCRNVMNKAQIILNYSDCVKMKDVIGVCSSCLTLGRRKPSCNKCKEVAENFIIWKRNRLGEEPPTSTLWLRRISETVKDLKEPHIKTRTYSDQDFYDKIVDKSTVGKKTTQLDMLPNKDQFYERKSRSVDREDTFKAKSDTDFYAKKISDQEKTKKRYGKGSSSDTDEDISDTQIKKSKMHKKDDKRTLSGISLTSKKSKQRHAKASLSQVDIERLKHKKLKKYHSLDTLLTSINKKEKKSKKNFVYLFPEELKKKPKMSAEHLKAGGKKKTKNNLYDDEDDDRNKNAKASRKDAKDDKSKKKKHTSTEDPARDGSLAEQKKGQESKEKREKANIKQKSDRLDDKTEAMDKTDRTGKRSRSKDGKYMQSDDDTKLGKGKRGGTISNQEKDKGISKDKQDSKKGVGEVSDKKSKDIFKKLENRDKADIGDGRKAKLKKSDLQHENISPSKDAAKRGKRKGDDESEVDKEELGKIKKNKKDGNERKSKGQQGKSGIGKESKKGLLGKEGDTVAGDGRKSNKNIDSKKRSSLGESQTKIGGGKKSKASDLLMRQILAQRSSPDNAIKAVVGVKTTDPLKKPKQSTPGTDVTALLKRIKRPVPEADDLSSSGLVVCDMRLESDHEFIVGEIITKNKPSTHEKDSKMNPLLFKTVLRDEELHLTEKSESNMPDLKQKNIKEDSSGVTHYALSDRRFIDMGWTMLPTEKVVRKMNVYRMRPAHPEFDWFEHNKHKKTMFYDSGEKLAEFDENGRGKWFYRSGRLALDYYQAEEVNAQQRFVIYGSGEIDERGRSRSVSVLAMFDYLGNGVVLDNAGKIRLKYNQTEGIILDRSLGPVSHWKWHTLNDPPVLQQVMIDTQLAHKDQEILQINSKSENAVRLENEEMLAIEFDNFIKEKSKKLAQTFKPFQIKMKALKINEYFSLKVLDQATVYLIYRDGTTNIKVNIGMVLDHKEIVDTDTADLGEVSNSIERFPARTESLEGLQRSVAQAQRCEAARVGLERRLRPALPVASADRLTAGLSKPLRRPLQLAPNPNCPFLARKKNLCPNLYYDTRIV